MNNNEKKNIYLFNFNRKNIIKFDRIYFFIDDEKILFKKIWI